MTEQQNKDPRAAEAQPAPRKGSWQLKAILIVTFVPLIAAYVAYYTGWGVPQSTVNNGRMLQPALDIKPLLADAEGTVPVFEDRREWMILVPVGADCGEACAKNLYVTRQVDIRLGEKSVRVERYVLNVGAEAGSAYLRSIAKDHPNLQVLSAKPSRWQNWVLASNLPPSTEQHHSYFLVDPQGFAMMKYTEQHHGNQLLKDIKRILRYSPED